MKGYNYKVSVGRMEAAAEYFGACLAAVDCPEASGNLAGRNIPQPNTAIE